MRDQGTQIDMTSQMFNKGLLYEYDDQILPMSAQVTLRPLRNKRTKHKSQTAYAGMRPRKLKMLSNNLSSGIQQ